MQLALLIWSTGCIITGVFRAWHYLKPESSHKRCVKIFQKPEFSGRKPEGGHATVAEKVANISYVSVAVIQRLEIDDKHK